MSGGLTDWLVQVMHQLNYVGIFLLLVLARVVPPVPAESVIPLAGIGAATGEYSLLGIALAGGLGSLVGQLVWFLPSRLMGRDRLEAFLKTYGPWLTIHPKKVRRSTDWFEKRGGLAVLFSQPVPGVRTLISIPAGACRMPILNYCLAAGIGSVVWTLVLAWTGYTLSSWPFAHTLVGYFTVGLLVLLVGLYLVRLVGHLRLLRKGRNGAAAPQPLTPSPGC
ncbi:DedA family protein [Azospirillum doebereinerae]|uniref:DedA family protein n=1 Tax=Azospirillum doebereinerae TaxID=92933 RepID=A0A3S1CJH7_9PROT|nr:DedA family protein [Azospirillum doebereinerae]MCG5239134.1 DedA family protein [Azospirillum doebereinerae]RUQ75671.1 DedA family protein [Azospirillum doebereinerae]